MACGGVNITLQLSGTGGHFPLECFRMEPQLKQRSRKGANRLRGGTQVTARQ
jgi:hypothetical protein